jgi:hypothetical protein
MAAKRKFTLAQEAISTKIVRVRRKQVVLDHHVAELYGVPTREVNRAVKTHPEKFLKGYVIKLNSKELSGLRWKNSTANATKRRTPPKAFTEKGLYMLATILKSKQATQATLHIVETFAKVREFSKTAKALALQKDHTKQQTLLKKSGALIGDILNSEFAKDTSSETTIELNLAMLKIKHTIKKEAKK